MKNIYQRINIIKLIKILFQWLKAKKGFLIIVRELKNKIRLAEYKRRQAPPGLRVSPKAFGMGRRFPIVNQYKSNQSIE